jgi:hypothetical protein
MVVVVEVGYNIDLVERRRRISQKLVITSIVHFEMVT